MQDIRSNRLIFGIFIHLALVLQHTWRQQGEREVGFDKTSLILGQLFQCLVTRTGYVLYELYCILIVFIFSQQFGLYFIMNEQGKSAKVKG